MAINIQKFAQNQANKVKTPFKLSEPKPDLTTPEGLARYAQSLGLDEYANPILETEKKLSILQRISAGLSAFNPANAISTGLEKDSFVEGVREYGTDIAQGLGAFATGRDYIPDRKMFKDIVEDMGVENGILKYGLGFLGDVFLDPSTYFGGALLRAGAKALGVASSTGLKAVGKVAPEVEAGARLIGKGVKDSFGRLFQYAYQTSGRLGQEYLRFQTRVQNMVKGINTSNLVRLGGEAMSESVAKDYVERSITGRIGEYAMRELLGEELVQKQNEAMKNLTAQLSGTEKLLGRKVSLKDLTSIGKDNAEKLEKAGFNLTRLARAGDVGTFAGNTFSPEIEQVAKILGVAPEKAKELSDVANGILEYASRENAAYTKQAGELIARIKDVKGWKIDYDKAGAYGTKLALDGADPLVEKMYKAQQLRNMKFARDKGITEPFRNYYPAIKDEEAVLKKILAESNRQGVRVGSEGWAKKFNNLIDRDEWLKNAPKAFSARETAMAKDFMSEDFLRQAVKRYGKPLEAYRDAREALPDGYRLITTKGTAGGIPLGDKIGWMKEADFNFLNGQINDQYPAISMLAKATGFDFINRLFKRSVTVPFLPFHVRNYVSGILQNYEVVGREVLDPRVQASAMKIAWAAVNGAEHTLKGVIRVGDEVIPVRKVMKPFFELFGNDPGMWAEMAGAMEKGVVPTGKIFSKQALKATAKTMGLGEESILFRGGRNVSNFIEIQQKAVAYVATLAKGKSVNQALSAATHAGFNYNALTPFESQIMRRIIPFYSFTRKNIELQLRTLAQNPERVNHILRLMDVGKSPTAEEKKGLPAFIRESLGVKVEDLPNGIKVYLARFGTPVESFTDIISGNPILNGISMMNPALKVPIEIGIGKDSFRETDLKDTYTANDISILPGPLKDLLDMTPVQKDILEKQSNGKLKKVGEQTVWVADPVKLLIFRSLFSSRGVTYLDKIFDGDLDGFYKVLSLTTGIRPYNVNPEAVIAVDNKEKERELVDLLQRRANLKVFERPFIPK